MIFIAGMKCLVWMVALVVVQGTAEQVFQEEAPLEDDKVPPYIAHVSMGDIEGFKDVSTNGKSFFSFLGVPYAKAPVGELRFKDPVALESWGELVNGLQAPPLCSQIDIPTLVNNGTTSYLGQEDCLYMNIYTPEFDEDLSDLPVMVFIPGISYASADASTFQPHDFMDHNIVLVVLQYRLGVLGFLSTEDLAISGNFGLKDQTLALKWINKYINHFGGNNLRVTLFGQGSGASSVHLQMLSHHTIGLFQRAILQSGNALCPSALGGVHREASLHIADHFNCSLDITDQQKTEDLDEQYMKHQNVLKCLQQVDAKKLTMLIKDFYVWGALPILFGPYVDGRFLADTPEFLLKESRHKKVDMLIGTVKDEGSFYVHPLFANEGHRLGLKFNFPTVGPISLEFTNDDIAAVNMSIKAYDFYVGGLKIDASDANNVTKLYGDRHQTVSADLVALKHYENSVRLKKKIFLYEFQYRGSRSYGDNFNLMFGKQWVSHGDELLYLFPKKDVGERTSEDSDMTNIMTKLWVNFAATGNPTPNDELGFQWDSFTQEQPSHLAIHAQPHMQEDQRAEVRQFWNSLPTRQNLYMYPSQFAELIQQIEDTKRLAQQAQQEEEEKEKQQQAEEEEEKQQQAEEEDEGKFDEHNTSADDTEQTQINIEKPDEPQSNMKTEL